MVMIRPFRALAYDWNETEGEPETVTSPPYDVITPEQVARLKRASVHNLTHLTLPETAPGKAPESRYGEAARLLKTWRKEGILRHERDPAFFVYRVTYEAGGKTHTATGFAGLLRLDPDYNEVRGHERTHKGPIEDRLALLRATRMDLEPIEFLYRDPTGVVAAALEPAMRKEPWLAFTDPAGTSHTVWRVADPQALEDVQAFFEGRRAYIADGHHRYATALHYANERRGDGDPVDHDADAADEIPGYESKLAVFFEADDAGLTVHPTHRLVAGLSDAAGARARLRERFGTEPLRVAGDAAERAARLVKATQPPGDAHRFVFYWGDGEADVLVLPHRAVPQDALPDRSAAWRRLDVSVLHHHVLPETLGVTEENAGEVLRYTRIDQEAVESVDSGAHQVAIILNATPLSAVTEVADAGEHMPQKSTYFLPKLQSGLFFASL